MDDKSSSIDLRTPRNVSLTAFYRRSFAFHTVKNRIPVILTQLIDTLVRKKDEFRQTYGKEGQDELKGVIGEISKLKYEVQTNKPISVLAGSSSDIKFYNNYLVEQSSKVDHPTYFNAIWLHTECYIYRKLREIFERTVVLKDFDPFQYQKHEAFASSLQQMVFLGNHLESVLSCSDCNLEEEFIKLLKLNLWGNRCDLSITAGAIKATSNHLLLLDELNSHILSDHSTKVWDAASNQDVDSNIIDIVLDNSGYELFTDLCLSDFLIKFKLAQKVRFYIKDMPWFISDVTNNDFNWTLQQLKDSNNTVLKKCSDRWKEYIKTKVWTVETHSFWTLPIPFTNMAQIDPELYEKLGHAKLIIFKGDLNYRKLFGERNWDPATPVDEALQGFHPSRLCTLRTLKADIVCGLREGLAQEVEERDADWMITGEYGVIQYSDQIVKIK